MRILGLLARPLAAVVPPATAAAMPCALAGIAGWLLLHRVAVRVSSPAGSPTAVAAVATFAVGLTATSAPVVLHSIDSEVWGPLVALAGLVVWAGLVRRVQPFGLGLLFGLALGQHLTAALLLPVCVTAAWPERTTPRAVLRAGVAGVAGTALAMTAAYATLMIGRDGAWRWGEVDTLAGLVHHVTRGDYGVLSLSLHAESPPALAQLARVGRSLGGALSAGLVTVPLAGAALVTVLWIVAARARTALPRRRVAGLAAAAVLSAAGFPLLHNLDPTSPFAAWILERFDILTLALGAPLLAAALAAMLAAVGDRHRARVGLGVCAGLLLVRQILVTAWNGVPSDAPEIQRYAQDLVHTPDPGTRALVFGTDDHRLFPVLFEHEVLGEGREVLYIDASLLAYPWYRARLRERFPELPDIDKPVRLISAIWADPALRDIPIYLANDFSLPSSRLPRVPEGILWRILPPHRLDVPIDEVVARHLAALRRYGPPPRGPLLPGHPFAGDLGAAYRENTAKLAAALDAQGRGAQAQAVLQEALEP